MRVDEPEIEHTTLLEKQQQQQQQKNYTVQLVPHC